MVSEYIHDIFKYLKQLEACRVHVAILIITGIRLENAWHLDWLADSGPRLHS